MKTNKVHPITAFRKANEARQKTVKTSLKKAQKGYTVTNADGSPMVTPSDYRPPSVPTYPDFKKLRKTDPRNIAFRQLATNPEDFRPKDVKKYGPKTMTKRQMNKMNKNIPAPIRINPDGTQTTMNKKGGSVKRKK